jgi:hypothetical protein
MAPELNMDKLKNEIEELAKKLAQDQIQEEDTHRLREIIVVETKNAVAQHMPKTQSIICS